MKWSLAIAICCSGACAAEGQALRPRAVQAGTVTTAATPAAEWQTTLDRGHALVGKVWDVEARAFSDSSALFARLARARFVLLGERHDNADHHRLQARAIASLLGAGRRPALVFEMLEVEQQPAVDRYLAEPQATAAGFGAALAWDKTSWPPFAEYRAIFDQAFAGKLPILAGNVAQSVTKRLVKEGLGALPDSQVKELHLDEAFPPALEAALLEELRASHCGMLPESLLGPMALAQHARDAQMAHVLASAGARDGAVLIAGAGHAQRDRGVPYHLAREMPEANVASVALVEVQHDQTAPETYVAARADSPAPFDYLWFTPRATDQDPCAAFHQR